jgi:hypothetical protein
MIVYIYGKQSLMLLSEQFVALTQHLNSLCHVVPYQWGRTQIKEFDRKLPKLFEYQTYDELNVGIDLNVVRGLIPDDEDQKNYYRHRWYVYRCSLGDEYVFKSLPNIAAAGRYNLELKGAVCLREGKDDPKYMFRVPLAMIDALYKQESIDFHSRRRLQNRLFLVHHSFINQARELMLRVAFDEKTTIFAEYAKLFSNPAHKLFDYYYSRKADIIFFVEREDGTLEYGFGSENPKGAIIFKQLSNKLN